MVLMLRWGRPVRTGDVVVVLGARRRWPFRREGPNGLALLVEAYDTKDSQSSTRCRLACNYPTSRTPARDPEVVPPPTDPKTRKG
ncbi:hypothetical protein Taro_051730 [Colocasia esculenta]|uniref:Uncharacterized protein n=1 Tax=Colocasia esculenta TaxID=4460 RepID=A0A843XHX2_COLES|nr:hypothetical protein [Colocasia esculenta]